MGFLRSMGFDEVICTAEPLEATAAASSASSPTKRSLSRLMPSRIVMSVAMARLPMGKATETPEILLLALALRSCAVAELGSKLPVTTPPVSDCTGASVPEGRRAPKIGLEGDELPQ
ncbi:MAG: hypothetical protein EOP07_24885 [Proteobacteria bacterium]|nr:MAG: hypothetical protein EOP07_24885 [Pseudomonadota bacterium]